MNIAFVRFIAARLSGDVRGRRRFSFSKGVAFVSVMLGSLALVVSLSVLGGFDESLHNLASQFSSHIQLRSRVSSFISSPERECALLQKQYPQIQVIVPVVQFDGLIFRKGLTEGIVLASALDSATGRSIGIQRHVVDGSDHYSSPEAREVIIGKKLARSLSCKAGDTVMVSLSRNGLADVQSVETVRFTVIGIYESGMAQYDDVYAYAPLHCLQHLISSEVTYASVLHVWIDDERTAGRLALTIEKSSGFALMATTVEELHRGMFSWIELQKKPIPIVLGLISIVAVFNILTTLLISIVEKSSSYAILLSMGISRSHLLAIVAWQGSMLGLVGSLAGCAVAYLFCVLQQQYGLIHLDGQIYFLNTLPVHVAAWQYALVVSLSLTLSLVVTLVPGFIATKIRPVSALRFK